MRTAALLAALAAGAVMMPSAIQAQRAPGYEAARSAGQVAEQVDGYLGFPSSPTPAVQAVASDINIKRKAVYTRQAAASGATVEEFAFTAGCNLIGKTAAGEKYQAPDGSWQTRTAAPAIKHPRCP